MNHPLYFAFGSNLSTAQMARRCPKARAEVTATLMGHRLAFGGHSASWSGAVATLHRSSAGQVEGLIYRMPPGEFERLDRYEGAPFLYERVRATVTDVLGKKRRVHTYVLRHDPPGTPSVDYLLTILRAYERLGFNRRRLLAAAYGCSRCIRSSCTGHCLKDSAITAT